MGEMQEEEGRESGLTGRGKGGKESSEDRGTEGRKSQRKAGESGGEEFRVNSGKEWSSTRGYLSRCEGRDGGRMEERERERGEKTCNQQRNRGSAPRETEWRWSCCGWWRHQEQCFRAVMMGEAGDEVSEEKRGMGKRQRTLIFAWMEAWAFTAKYGMAPLPQLAAQ